MQLLIDKGNSRTKWVLCDQTEWLEQGTLPTDHEIMPAAWQPERISHVLMSNVGDTGLEMALRETFDSRLMGVHDLPDYPFAIPYTTPETLGADRIANAASAYATFPGEHVLIFDCGTCLTTTFLHANRGLLGGSISPGWSMRLNAMHHFTGRLPAVDPVAIDPWDVPDSTHQALASGAFFGVIDEIQQQSLRYENRFGTVRCILTGGYAREFEKHLKSNIFADRNFTLRGLNVLQQHYIHG